MKVLKAVVKSAHRISYYTICGNVHVEIVPYIWVWTFCFHSRDEYLTIIESAGIVTWILELLAAPLYWPTVYGCGDRVL